MSDTLFQEIVKLQREGKISRLWKIKDLKIYLSGNFSDSTLSVYPYNASISRDGKKKGNFVIRGQKPKFFKHPGGFFEIIDEHINISRKIHKEFYENEKNFEAPKKQPPNYKNTFNNKEDFLSFVEICNTQYRRYSPSTVLYKGIVEKHREYSLNKLLSQDSFYELLYATLISWNMNQRGARLSDFEAFKKSIFNVRFELIQLSRLKISDLVNQDMERTLFAIAVIYQKLNIMNSKSKLVGNSKTFHFLLPDLLMPVDRSFTLKFFFGHTNVSNNFKSEFRKYQVVLRNYIDIILGFNLSNKDVDGKGWNTSLPKLIDNAIIGYISKIKE